MALKRTNLIMEIGAYGGGGGGRSAGGFAVPVSTRRFNTWPFIPNAELLMQKEMEADRRRNRLRELALGWFIAGDPSLNSTSSPTTSQGATPNSIF